MRVFREGICIVSKDELFKCSLPDYLVFDREVEGMYITSDADTISYIRGRISILNYDEVMSLSKEQLIRLYEYYVARANSYLQMINSRPNMIHQNDVFISSFERYESLAHSVADYINEKDYYDELIYKCFSYQRRKAKQA